MKSYLSKLSTMLLLGGFAICGAIALFDLHVVSAEVTFFLGIGMVGLGAVLKIFVGGQPGKTDENKQTHTWVGSETSGGGD